MTNNITRTARDIDMIDRNEVTREFAEKLLAERERVEASPIRKADPHEISAAIRNIAANSSESLVNRSAETMRNLVVDELACMNVRCA